MSSDADARSEWSVGVVVPARNEQARIRRCLDSVLTAIDTSGVCRAWVVVVADRCTDRTVSISHDVLAGRGEVIEADAGSPGAARKIGVDAVLSALPDAQPDRLWLANTDADSYVPADWIAHQLQLAMDGVAGIAGIVAVDSFRTHGAGGANVFARHYMLNADGSHPHVHGANLGMRADTYLDAGGWRDIPAGEDHCLWGRVRERGWRVRATTASVVTTSGRLRGRARGGFADTLRARLRATPADVMGSAVGVPT